MKRLLSRQLDKFKNFGELDEVFIWKIMQSRLFGIMDLDTHLNTTNVFCPIRPGLYPALPFRGIGLCDADFEIAKHAGEELKVGELNSIDPDVVTKFDDNKVRLGGTGAEHVSVLFRREDSPGGTSRAVGGVNTRGAVKRRIVEAIGEGHAEMWRAGGDGL